MKRIILILLLTPAILFSQWVQQYPPVGIELILSIDFSDTNTGIAGGWGGGFFGKAVYTTNSGANWFLAQVPDSSRSLVKVQLIDNNTGYIAGAYNIFKKDNLLHCNVTENNSVNRFQNYYERIGMTGEREDYRGLFLKTTNGGKNWFTQGTLPSNVYYLMGMRFINLNTGFVSASLEYSGGVRNAVLKTTNGGLNWYTLYQIDTADINNIYTTDGNTVFITGWKKEFNDTSKGMILRTTNGGNNWNIHLNNEAEQFFDVNFTNSLTGFAVSSISGIIIGPVIGSAIFKTTNNGVNWIKLGVPDTLLSLVTVEFVPGTGKGFSSGFRFSPEYLLESIIIRSTTNYGANWTDYIIPDSVHILHGSSIVDANTWFIAGGINNAIVYKTTNGSGSIGIEPISSEVPERFVLYQNYPNPFNPGTKIKFDTPLNPPEGGTPDEGASTPLSSIGEGLGVRLVIYDILGREIAVLVNEGLKPGTYEVEWDASDYPSGVYFYKLSAGNYRDTKKMVLIK